MTEPLTTPAIVVMAKPAVPGQVKTRLLKQFNAQQAARIHTAMLECVLHRAQEHISAGRHVDCVIALDCTLESTSACDEALQLEIPAGWRQIDQGVGDLGQRLAHVWQVLSGRPIVYLGVDSPDVPAQDLSGILAALERVDAVVGPVDDGGYWTLALRRWEPSVFEGIDWGTPSVYYQTLAAAKRAGLKLAALTPWYDVDRPIDLDALCLRIANAQEPALVQLRKEINRILS